MDKPYTPTINEWDYIQRNSIRRYNELLDFLEKRGMVPPVPCRDAVYMAMHDIDAEKLAQERAELDAYQQWATANQPLRWQTVAAVLKKAGHKQVTFDGWHYMGNGFRTSKRDDRTIEISARFSTKQFGSDPDAARLAVEAIEDYRKLLSDAGFIVKDGYYPGSLLVSRPEVTTAPSPTATTAGIAQADLPDTADQTNQNPTSPA